jgi:hydroxylysine kinase
MSETGMDVDPSGDALLSENLSSAAHEISLEEAQRIATQRYGISGRASRLTSERDHNFRIIAADGLEYVLKLSNAAEDEAIAAFQAQALLHVAQVDPELSVPRVIAARDGKTHLTLHFHDPDSGSGPVLRTVRLLSYLPGVPLNLVPRTGAHCRDLGGLLARLGLALRGFFHPAAGHDLAWDIKNTSRLRSLVPHVPDPCRRALVLHFLDDFAERAQPRLPALRAQVVHNDLNAYNVLVDSNDHERIAGILDFGDLVYTSLINDVAVGASYHMSTGPDALDGVIGFVAAYHATAPLERSEIGLLFDLIAARFVTTVLITGWRAARYPQNSAYILKNNPGAWSGLESLYALTREPVLSRLRHACNME